MKKFIIFFSVLIVILVVGLIALPSLIPSSVYKETIETELSRELAREVRVKGDVKLSVFPIIKANTGRVEIDNPDGFAAENFAEMNAMSARIKLFPLFSKRVEIASFKLKNPSINLEKLANGQTNWAFNQDEAPASDPVEAGPFKRDGRFNAVDPNIGDFSLENGMITYNDAQVGTNIEISDVNLDFSLPSLAQPVEIEGALTYNGTPAEIDLTLNSLRAFLDGKEAPVSLALKTDFADINAKGRFLAGPDIIFNMDVDGDVSSLSKLAAFSPKDVPYVDLIQSAKLSGNYGYDGTTVTARGADISAIGTDFSAAFKGDATLAEKPIFDGQVNLDAKNIAALAKEFGQEVKGLSLLSTVKLSADFARQGSGFEANNIDAAITGDGLSGNFKGTGQFDETISANGTFNADVKSISNKLAALDVDIPQAKILQALTASGSLDMTDKTYRVTNLDANITGDGLSGNYKGSATYADALSANGTFNADIRSVANTVAALELDIPQAATLQALTASGNVDVAGKTYKVTNLNSTIAGDGLSGTYKGAATYGEALSADGSFTANVTSVANTAAAFKVDLPEAKALQGLTASGNVSMAGKNIRLANLDAKTEGGVLSGSYKGGASLGGTPAFDGNFDVALTSLSEFAAITAKEIPYADTIGRIAINGSVSGQGQAITLPTLTAALTNGKINGRYDGRATWNKGASLDGQLNIDIPSLRDVASAGGTELPPSTASGNIFGPFSVNGNVKGTPDDIKFDQATISLDNIKGQGSFSIDMEPATPYMTGTLNLDGLDLSPYMAAYSAQKPTGQIQPWSTAPINSAALRAINGDFKFTTPNIKTDRITMGQSDITSKLRGGIMTTNMPNIALYGGLGRMIATLDGSRSTTRVSLEIGLNDVNSNSFLASVAGFTQAKGDLGSLFKISGQGTSQAAIMKSLNGEGNFKLLDGEINGVDLPTLLTGLDQAFTSRSLPSGIGPSHTTKFSDISGLVSINNGVASINQFSLTGLGVLAEGRGQIDLGNQRVDFSLRPRLTGKNVNDLASFGIPIKVQGNFGNAKVGLDTDMIGNIVAERARAKAASLITDQIGGSAGGILGGVIGGSSSGTQGGSVGSLLGGVVGASSPRTQTPGTQTSGTQTGTPRNTEEVVGGLLGGLLGGQQAPAPTQSGTPPQTAPKEPSVEDALIGLFGKKKKKKSGE